MLLRCWSTTVACKNHIILFKYLTNTLQQDIAYHPAAMIRFIDCGIQTEAEIPRYCDQDAFVERYRIKELSAW